MPHAAECRISIAEPSHCSDVYPPPVVHVFLTPVKSLKLVNLHPLLPGWLKHTPWNNTHTLWQVSGIECHCQPTVRAWCVAPDVLCFRFDLFSMTCWSEQLRLFVFTAVMWHLNPQQEGGGFVLPSVKRQSFNWLVSDGLDVFQGFRGHCFNVGNVHLNLPLTLSHRLPRHTWTWTCFVYR